jgi:uncharacterized repeat protein (TIGR01451 family)
MRKRLFSITSLLVLLSMILVPFNSSQSASDISEGFELEAVDPNAIQPLGNLNPTVIGKSSPTGLYIVRLTDPSLAAYKGGIAGFEATSPVVTGARKLDVNAPASQAYLSYLEGKQKEAVNAIQTLLGRTVDLEFQYLNVLNGMAVYASYDEALKIAGLPGVAEVYADKLREMDTDVGPFLIGADSIWTGDTESGLDTKGEGIIIGMIDSGINHAHPSFADIGGDGYNHDNPYGTGNYFGLCETDPAYSDFCNDKLIGAYDLYPGGSDGGAEDTDGHGSHTSSTAGGNQVEVDIGPVITRTIQGVAPHANLIAYKVCDPGCPDTSSVAAVDHAIEDLVDVLNFSISGGDDPWDDSVDLAFLEAFGTGIFVSASAGNNGPVTVAHTGPWNATVAASTHNRVVANTLDVISPTPPPELTDLAAVPGEGTVLTTDLTGSITYDPTNLTGCTAFSADFSGVYALVQRGGCDFVVKVNNAVAAGAIGVVMFNNVGGPPITMGGLTGTPPAVMLDLADGTALKDYIDASAPVSIRINDELNLIIKDEWQDIMAGFSSTGPSQFELVKPDYTAPGVNILAAVAAVGVDPVQFGFYQGTSMSSPHSAGSAALMLALNPSWSPAEVKSAMSSTAYDGLDLYKPDGTTPSDPFDRGSGRLDLSGGGRVGFVLDENYDNFLAANPADGGDPKTLNLASMADYQCLGECSWTRVLTSTVPYTVTWTTSFSSADGVDATVDPASFELGPYASQTITINADASGAPLDDYSFGNLLFTSDDLNLAVSHFPMVVVHVAAQLPETVEIETRRNAGSELLPDITANEITDLTTEYYGFVQADLTTEMLSQDLTNGDPYDNLNDGTVFYITTTAPADAYSLIAEITESEAFDIDLFVGAGDNPSAATQLCSSTTPSWDEYCELSMPAEGTYWILVQNWSESGSPPDLVTLASAVVTMEDAGNMMVEGPASVPLGDPFDLRVYWDTPEMVAGDRWYGAFTLGTDPGNPGNLGTVPVKIIREEDDVTKQASSDVVLPGDTITYTITVQPNITSEDLTYTLTDTIPAGLTYVDDSASASMGVVEVTGDTLTWTGLMPVPGYTYEIETSNTDPACAMPFANSGAYTNLQAFNIFAIPGIAGNAVAYTVNFAGGEHNLFGDYYGENLNFTDDGFAFLDPSTPGGPPWDNDPIPTGGDPNNLMAMFWRDLEIVYDAGLNSGVSLANLTNDEDVPVGFVLEYDDVEDRTGPPGSTYDFELFGRYDPGDDYEYIFAYDNLNGDVISGTIGLENVTGSSGVQYAYNDIDVTNGMAICFDLVTTGVLATITYNVTVDNDVAPGADLINNVVHNTDAIGSLSATTSYAVHVQDEYGVELTPSEDALTGVPGERVEYTLTLMNTGSASDTYDIAYTGNLWNVHLPETSVTVGAGESATVIVHVDIPTDALPGESDIVTVSATSVSDITSTDSSVLTTTAGLRMYFLPFVP